MVCTCGNYENALSKAIMGRQQEVLCLHLDCCSCCGHKLPLTSSALSRGAKLVCAAAVRQADGQQRRRDAGAEIHGQD